MLGFARVSLCFVLNFILLIFVRAAYRVLLCCVRRARNISTYFCTFVFFYTGNQKHFSDMEY